MATNNRSQASAKSRREAQLNQLNDIGTSRSEFDTASTLKVIEVAALDFIARVTDNINTAKNLHVNTGEIENITLQTTDIAVNVLINNHLLFQDLGVNGNEEKRFDTPFTYRNLMPPVQVFRDLIKNQNIQLRNEEDYGGDPSRFEELDNDEKAINKAAWGMAKNIQKSGFRGHQIYSREIPKLVEDIKNQVADFSVSFLTAQIINNDKTRTTIR